MVRAEYQIPPAGELGGGEGLGDRGLGSVQMTAGMRYAGFDIQLLFSSQSKCSTSLKM